MPALSSALIWAAVVAAAEKTIIVGGRSVVIPKRKMAKEDPWQGVRFELRKSEDVEWQPLEADVHWGEKKGLLDKKGKLPAKIPHEATVKIVKPIVSPEQVRLCDIDQESSWSGSCVPVKSPSLEKDWCKPGSFSNEQTQQCEECPEIDGCQRENLRCTTDKDGTCELCDKGLYASGSKCEKCKAAEGCEPDEISCTDAKDTKCGKCADGWYDSDDPVCTKCPEVDGCRADKVECSSSKESTCREGGCEPNFFRDGDACAMCNPVDNCKKVECDGPETSVCVLCEQKYELKEEGGGDGTLCKKCQTSTQACNPRKECDFRKITVPESTILTGRGGTPRLGDEPLRIHGLRYVPLPIGMSSTRYTSIYDREYEALHERDLKWMLELSNVLVVQPPLPGLATDQKAPFRRFSVFYNRLMDKKHELGSEVKLIFAFSLVPYKRVLENLKVTEEQIAKDFVFDLKKFAAQALKAHYCDAISIAIGARPEKWEVVVDRDRYAKVLEKINVEINQDRKDPKPQLPADLSVAWSVRLEDLLEKQAKDSLNALYSSQEALLLIHVDDDQQKLREIGDKDSGKGSLIQLPDRAAPVFVVRLAGVANTGNSRFEEVIDALEKAGLDGTRRNIIVDPIDQWWLDPASCPPHSPFVPSPCGMQNGGLFRQYDDVLGRHCLMPRKQLLMLLAELWDPHDPKEVAKRVKNLVFKHEDSGICTDRPLIKPREYLRPFSTTSAALNRNDASSEPKLPSSKTFWLCMAAVLLVTMTLGLGAALAVVINLIYLIIYLIMWLIGWIRKRSLGGSGRNDTEEQQATILFQMPDCAMTFKLSSSAAEEREAEAQLKGHVIWQHDIILKMFQHETVCTEGDGADVEKKALQALYKRLLEKPFEVEALPDTVSDKVLFAELVRAKVVMSMMEHALHAPKRVRTVLRQLRKDRPIEEGGGDMTVDLGKLHELRKGLDAVNNGDINFDDMDDGCLQEKGRFCESTGWWVLLDMACHLHELLIVRAWVAFVAYYKVYPPKTVTQAEICKVWHPLPAQFGEPYFQTEVPCDSWKLDAYFSTGLYLLLYTSRMWQEAGLLQLRWFSSAGFPIFCVVIYRNLIPGLLPYLESQNYLGLRPEQLYLYVRPSLFLATTVLFKYTGPVKRRLRGLASKGGGWSALQASSKTLFVVGFWWVHTLLSLLLDKEITWRTVSMFNAEASKWNKWTARFKCDASCGLSAKDDWASTMTTSLVKLLLGDAPVQDEVVAGGFAVLVVLVMLFRKIKPLNHIIKTVLSLVMLAVPVLAMYNLFQKCSSHLCAALAFSKSLAYVYAAVSAISVSFGLFFMLSTWCGFAIAVWGLRSTLPDPGSWREHFKRIYLTGETDKKEKIAEVEQSLINDLKARHLLPQTWDHKEQDRQSLPALGFPLAKHVLDRLDASLAADDFAKGNTMARYDPTSTPKLSQVICVYAEDILYTEKALCEATRATGMLSLLEHLVYTQPAEWESFAESDNIKQLANSLQIREQMAIPGGACSQLGPQAYALLDAFLNRDKNEGGWDELSKQIRLWASYRSQHASRTVRGAMAYHKVLKNELKNDDDDLAELVLAHQTYGQGKHHDADVEMLLEEYKEHQLVLVHDYTRGSASPEMKERVREFWSQNHMPRNEPLQPEIPKDGKIQNPWPFEYATLVTKWKDNGVKLVAVMPRQYPLRLGKGAYSTQGKSANQLNALRCVSGHVLQVLDMNMDFFPSEALKVPQMLRNFYPDADPKERLEGPKLNILGFREHVYTGVESSCGQVMANAEYAFGTIFQSALANALDVRLHYGHPDFVDVSYVLTHGGMSKASPNINLSEDAFLGYANLLSSLEQGGATTDNGHKDVLEWHKGREVEFSSADGFLRKIAGGAATMLRSRDLHRLYQRLDLFTKASLFMGAHGSYFAHLFSYIGVLVYTVLYLNLVVSGLIASDFFSAPDNILRMPALPVSTIVNILPLVVQKFTDSGGSIWEVFRVLKFELLFASYAVSCQIGLFPNMSVVTKLSIGFVLYCLPPATAFFGFGNRSLVSSFLSSLETGRAGYIATGRPPPFKRVPLHQLYMRFAKSHYEPLMQLGTLVVLMCLLTREGETAIRLGVLVCPMLLWVLAPVLFAPHARSASLEMLQHFLIPVSKSNMLVALRDVRILDGKGEFKKPEPDKVDLSLMDWSAIHEHTEFVEPNSWYLKLLRFVTSSLAAGGLWLITPAIVKATVIYFCLAWCCFVVLTAPFFCFGSARPFLQLWLLIGLPSVYAFLLSTVYNTLPPLDEATRLLWAAVIHVMLGRILYDASLLLADPICAWWRKRAAHEGGEATRRQKLDEAAYVQVLHVLSLQYLVTSATAILTLSAQSICVCIFALLDQLGGYHSWYMFNQRVEHARAKPILDKGSTYRNDFGECWHAIKPAEAEADGDDQEEGKTAKPKRRDRPKSPIPERGSKRPAVSPPPARKGR